MKKEEIPIGARILAAVDCLDALASDRQYRKALPLDEAMAKVTAEAGTSFDPRIVGILERRYVDLERLAREEPQSAPPKLSTDIRIERGAAPAAGFAESEVRMSDELVTSNNSADAAVRARREAQTLFDLCRDLRNSLSLDDVFALLSVRLKRLVPHESMTIYLPQSGVLFPEWVSGDHFRLFSSLKIPLGEGLCGWVAQNRKPIVNGNPAVEPGYATDSDNPLRSALAVPIDGEYGVIAVVTLYRTQQDSFTRDDLSIVETLVSRVAATIEAAGKPKAAAMSVGR